MGGRGLASPAWPGRAVALLSLPVSSQSLSAPRAGTSPWAGDAQRPVPPMPVPRRPAFPATVHMVATAVCLDSSLGGLGVTEAWQDSGVQAHTWLSGVLWPRFQHRAHHTPSGGGTPGVHVVSLGEWAVLSLLFCCPEPSPLCVPAEQAITSRLQTEPRRTRPKAAAAQASSWQFTGVWSLWAGTR